LDEPDLTEEATHLVPLCEACAREVGGANEQSTVGHDSFGMYRVQVTNILSVPGQEGDEALVCGELEACWQVCDDAKGPLGKKRPKYTVA